MQTFFPSMDAIEHFTHALRSHTDSACHHCLKSDQLVSHGYIYKQRSIKNKETVGKRILCAKRHGKLGCGRTRQLYLASVLPRRQHLGSQLTLFIDGLLLGLTVTHAYKRLFSHHNTRHAWRWLSSLTQKLGCFAPA